MKHFLIAYISPNGSTAEVANFISQELQALGHQVTVQTFEQITSVTAYDGVVIAAPVHGMKWRPEAVNFVKTHQAQLSSKMVSYLAMALMVEYGRPMFRNAVQKAFNEVSTLVPPSATAIFSGVSKDKMPSLMRWVFGLPTDMASDARNWSKIEAFARKLHQTIEQ